MIQLQDNETERKNNNNKNSVASYRVHKTWTSKRIERMNLQFCFIFSLYFSFAYVDIVACADLNFVISIFFFFLLRDGTM